MVRDGQSWFAATRSEIESCYSIEAPTDSQGLVPVGEGPGCQDNKDPTPSPDY